MSVSVIVPLYNGGPWIREALDSVLAQTLVPDEIVVVDDGSTDSSPELVLGYPHVRLLANNGKGSSVARNVGLRSTCSRFVAFLDQDDVWHPAHLRLLVEALNEVSDANTAMATASCFEQGSPDYDAELKGMDLFDPWTRFPFTIGVEGPSLALVRREAMSAVGLWEECATGMGDALLFLKLAAIHPLLRRASRTVGKRIHASQQWLQVRELGASYLGFRHEVMKRALDFRRGCDPADLALRVYERRLEGLLILRGLTQIIESNQLEAAAPLAREMEGLLKDDPTEYLPHLFYCLMGALFKTHDAEQLRKERDRAFLRLLSYWPSDAARTRSALQGIIGEKPCVS